MPEPNTLQTAIQVLTIINTLEPPAVALVKTFLDKLQGKTTAEILDEADGIWQDVIDTAKKEIDPQG